MEFNCKSLLTIIQEDPSEEPNRLHEFQGISVGKGTARISFLGIGASEGKDGFLLLFCEVNPLVSINFEC